MVEHKKENKQIDVHYKKIDSYRTFYANGAFGGITPSGEIYMELFVQRQPTPQKVTYSVESNGTLGSEISKEGKVGIIREVECGMVFNVQTAKAIVEWLNKNIAELEKQDLVRKELTKGK